MEPSNARSQVSSINAELFVGELVTNYCLKHNIHPSFYNNVSTKQIDGSYQVSVRAVRLKKKKTICNQMIKSENVVIGLQTSGVFPCLIIIHLHHRYS